MRTLFYVVRHGETDDNARRVFQGHGGSGLNARGKAQARRLAERMGSASLTAIVSSDLERASETAHVVAGHVGRSVHLASVLREVDLGRWSGLREEQIAQQFPEEWSAWRDGEDIRRGGGETYDEASARVQEGLRDYASAWREWDTEGERASLPRVLVVTHGGVIRSLVARIVGVRPTSISPFAPVANCALTVIEFDASRGFTLHSWNDTSHLEGPVV